MTLEEAQLALQTLLSVHMSQSQSQQSSSVIGIGTGSASGASASGGGRWKLLVLNDDELEGDESSSSSPLIAVDSSPLLEEEEDEEKDDDKNETDNKFSHDKEVEVIPFALVKTFHHPTYLDGSKFVFEVIGAVCEMNQHYAYQVQLTRRIHSRKKTWIVETEVQLRTVVLGGLSSHDFMIASLIDIELERPDNQRLLLM